MQHQPCLIESDFVTYVHTMYIVRHTCIEGLLWCRLLVKGTLEDLIILVVSKPQLAHVRSCTCVPCDLTGSLVFNCETLD